MNIIKDIGALWLSLMALGAGELQAAGLTDSHTAAQSRVPIVLDIGHSLKLPGAIGASGNTEFSYNLALGQAIAAQLAAQKMAFRLVGDKGEVDDLGVRVGLHKGASWVFAIHHDSVQERLLPRSAEFAGFSLFVRGAQDQPALGCASLIGGRLRGVGRLPSLYHADPVIGESRALLDRVNGVHAYPGLAILRRTKTPVILIEAGVIVNAVEEAEVTSASVREKIAKAIAQAIAECADRWPQEQP